MKIYLANMRIFFLTDKEEEMDIRSQLAVWSSPSFPFQCQLHSSNGLGQHILSNLRHSFSPILYPIHQQILLIVYPFKIYSKSDTF